jgi:ribosomal protein S14
VIWISASHTTTVPATPVEKPAPEKPTALNGLCPRCGRTQPVFDNKWSFFSLCRLCIDNAEARVKEHNR